MLKCYMLNKKDEVLKLIDLLRTHTSNHNEQVILNQFSLLKPIIHSTSCLVIPLSGFPQDIVLTITNSTFHAVLLIEYKKNFVPSCLKMSNGKTAVTSFTWNLFKVIFTKYQKCFHLIICNISFPP